MNFTNEKGFTVVELLIAMMLTGIVTGFTFKAYRYFENSFYNWQQRVALQEVSRRIVSTVCSDLQLARAIEEAENTAIEMRSRDNRLVSYTLRNGLLLRNGHVLNKDKKMKITSLRFETFDEENQNISNHFSQEKVGRVEVRVAVKHKSGRKFKLVSSVCLRNIREFEYE